MTEILPKTPEYNFYENGNNVPVQSSSSMNLPNAPASLDETNINVIEGGVVTGSLHSVNFEAGVQGWEMGNESSQINLNIPDNGEILFNDNGLIKQDQLLYLDKVSS